MNEGRTESLDARLQSSSNFRHQPFLVRTNERGSPVALPQFIVGMRMNQSPLVVDMPKSHRYRNGLPPISILPNSARHSLPPTSDRYRDRIENPWSDRSPVKPCILTLPHMSTSTCEPRKQPDFGTAPVLHSTVDTASISHKQNAECFQEGNDTNAEKPAKSGVPFAKPRNVLGNNHCNIEEPSRNTSETTAGSSFVLRSTLTQKNALHAVKPNIVATKVPPNPLLEQGALFNQVDASSQPAVAKQTSRRPGRRQRRRISSTVSPAPADQQSDFIGRGRKAYTTGEAREADRTGDKVSTPKKRRRNGRRRKKSGCFSSQGHPATSSQLGRNAGPDPDLNKSAVEMSKLTPEQQFNNLPELCNKRPSETERPSQNTETSSRPSCSAFPVLSPWFRASFPSIGTQSQHTAYNQDSVFKEYDENFDLPSANRGYSTSVTGPIFEDWRARPFHGNPPHWWKSRPTAVSRASFPCIDYQYDSKSCGESPLEGAAATLGENTDPGDFKLQQSFSFTRQQDQSGDESPLLVVHKFPDTQSANKLPNDDSVESLSNTNIGNALIDSGNDKPFQFVSNQSCDVPVNISEDIPLTTAGQTATTEESFVPEYSLADRISSVQETSTSDGADCHQTFSNFASREASGEVEQAQTIDSLTSDQQKKLVKLLRNSQQELDLSNDLTNAVSCDESTTDMAVLLCGILTDLECGLPLTQKLLDLKLSGESLGNLPHLLAEVGFAGLLPETITGNSSAGVQQPDAENSVPSLTGPMKPVPSFTMRHSFPSGMPPKQRSSDDQISVGRPQISLNLPLLEAKKKACCGEGPVEAPPCEMVDDLRHELQENISNHFTENSSVHGPATDNSRLLGHVMNGRGSIAASPVPRSRFTSPLVGDNNSVSPQSPVSQMNRFSLSSPLRKSAPAPMNIAYKKYGTYLAGQNLNSDYTPTFASPEVVDGFSYGASTAGTPYEAGMPCELGFQSSQNPDRMIGLPSLNAVSPTTQINQPVPRTTNDIDPVEPERMKKSSLPPASSFSAAPLSEDTKNQWSDNRRSFEDVGYLRTDPGSARLVQKRSGERSIEVSRPTVRGDQHSERQSERPAPTSHLMPPNARSSSQRAHSLSDASSASSKRRCRKRRHRKHTNKRARSTGEGGQPKNVGRHFSPQETTPPQSERVISLKRVVPTVSSDQFVAELFHNRPATGTPKTFNSSPGAKLQKLCSVPESIPEVENETSDGDDGYGRFPEGRSNASDNNVTPSGKDNSLSDNMDKLTVTSPSVSVSFPASTELNNDGDSSGSRFGPPTLSMQSTGSSTTLEAISLAPPSLEQIFVKTKSDVEEPNAPVKQEFIYMSRSANPVDHSKVSQDEPDIANCDIRKTASAAKEVPPKLMTQNSAKDSRRDFSFGRNLIPLSAPGNKGPSPPTFNAENRSNSSKISLTATAPELSSFHFVNLPWLSRGVACQAPVLPSFRATLPPHDFTLGKPPGSGPIGVLRRRSEINIDVSGCPNRNTLQMASARARSPHTSLEFMVPTDPADQTTVDHIAGLVSTGNDSCSDHVQPASQTTQVEAVSAETLIDPGNENACLPLVASIAPNIADISVKQQPTHSINTNIGSKNHEDTEHRERRSRNNAERRKEVKLPKKKNFTTSSLPLNSSASILRGFQVGADGYMEQKHISSLPRRLSPSGKGPDASCPLRRAASAVRPLAAAISPLYSHAAAFESASTSRVVALRSRPQNRFNNHTESSSPRPGQLPIELKKGPPKVISGRDKKAGATSIAESAFKGSAIERQSISKCGARKDQKPSVRSSSEPPNLSAIETEAQEGSPSSPDAAVYADQKDKFSKVELAAEIVKLERTEPTTSRLRLDCLIKPRNEKLQMSSIKKMKQPSSTHGSRTHELPLNPCLIPSVSVPLEGPCQTVLALGGPKKLEYRADSSDLNDYHRFHEASTSTALDERKPAYQKELSLLGYKLLTVPNPTTIPPLFKTPVSTAMGRASAYSSNVYGNPSCHNLDENMVQRRFEPFSLAVGQKSIQQSPLYEYSDNNRSFVSSNSTRIRLPTSTNAIRMSQLTTAQPISSFGTSVSRVYPLESSLTERCWTPVSPRPPYSDEPVFAAPSPRTFRSLTPTPASYRMFMGTAGPDAHNYRSHYTVAGSLVHGIPSQTFLSKLSCCQEPNYEAGAPFWRDRSRNVLSTHWRSTQGYY